MTQKLIDHILQKHHAYVREEAPLIEELFEKAIGDGAKVAGMKSLFVALKVELLDHMRKEEGSVFLKITAGENVFSAIKTMEYEHEVAARFVSELQKQRRAVIERSSTISLLFEKLDAFFLDLERHVQLEEELFASACQ